MMKKKIRPDAFIYDLMKAVDLSGQEKALEEKFRIAFKDRIRELYEEFSSRSQSSAWRSNIRP